MVNAYEYCKQLSSLLIFQYLLIRDLKKIQYSYSSVLSALTNRQSNYARYIIMQ